MSHTPGPWSTNGTFIWPTADRSLIESRGDLFGMTLHPYFNPDGTASPHGQREANAALIAAAPDLLAALEAMYAVFGELPAARNYQAVIQNARAAIAKAQP